VLLVFMPPEERNTTRDHSKCGDEIMNIFQEAFVDELGKVSKIIARGRHQDGSLHILTDEDKVPKGYVRLQTAMLAPGVTHHELRKQKGKLSGPVGESDFMYSFGVEKRK